MGNAAVSLGGAFVSLEISSSFLIFFSLFSFILAWTFISLQIKEVRIMGLSINDSVYSCLFFFLTGLHFFHLLFGLFLCCLLFWSCSFSSSFSVTTPNRRLPEEKNDQEQFVLRELTLDSLCLEPEDNCLEDAPKVNDRKSWINFWFTGIFKSLFQDIINGFPEDKKFLL